MYNKLLNFLRGNSKKTTPNLIIGENSDVKSATFFKPTTGSKITIGKDCLIEGIISIYCDNAEINIGNNVFIGVRSLIGSACSINIGNDVLISYDCMIQDNDNHHQSYKIRKNDNRDWKNGQQHDWEITPKKKISIEKGAWIGAKVIILKGIIIGEGAVVGAGSVVTKDVKPYTLVAGNPARFIKEIK